MRIPQIEELVGLVLQVPELVGLQEGRSSEFAAGVSAWLLSVESCLTANRLYQAGRVAATRSSLSTMIAGRVPTDMEFRSHPSPSKILVAATSDALNSGVAVVSSLLDVETERLHRAETLACQIVAVARSKGVLSADMDRAPATPELMLEETRRLLQLDAETAQGLHHLEALLGIHDSFVILDRVLSRN